MNKLKNVGMYSGIKAPFETLDRVELDSKGRPLCLVGESNG